MNKQEALDCICSIPKVLHEKGNVSFYDLSLKAWHYSEEFKIKLNDVEDYLKKHQHYIQDWKQWCEDNRGFPAWGISEIRNAYIVGYSNLSGEDLWGKKSKDKYKQFALYIMMVCGI